MEEEADHEMDEENVSDEEEIDEEISVEEDEPSVFDRKPRARLQKAVEGVGDLGNAGSSFLGTFGIRFTDALKAATCLMDKNSEGPCDVSSLIFIVSICVLVGIFIYQFFGSYWWPPYPGQGYSGGYPPPKPYWA